MDNRTVSRVFVAAGVFNFLGAGIGLLTNNPVIEIYPAVFSRFGMLAIILWGMAYVAVAKSYTQVRPLVLVFFIEKVAYVGSWIGWWVVNYGETSTRIYQEKFIGWLFLAGYGIGDGVFAVFFLWVFLTTKNLETSSADSIE